MSQTVWCLEGYMNWWLDRTPLFVGVPMVVIQFATLALAISSLVFVPGLLMK